MPALQIWMLHEGALSKTKHLSVHTTYGHHIWSLYLNTCLRQVGAHGQTLTHHHVRVVCLLEGLLQGLQLLGGEGRATAPLLSVLGAIASL